MNFFSWFCQGEEKYYINSKHDDTRYNVALVTFYYRWEKEFQIKYVEII
jgi:hypothetical protein